MCVCVFSSKLFFEHTYWLKTYLYLVGFIRSLFHLSLILRGIRSNLNSAEQKSKYDKLSVCFVFRYKKRGFSSSYWWLEKHSLLCGPHSGSRVWPRSFYWWHPHGEFFLQFQVEGKWLISLSVLNRWLCSLYSSLEKNNHKLFLSLHRRCIVLCSRGSGM